ncbi:hypothetical protein LOTGIDRAFT_161780 [Lottia gigantea]|uniref:Uncharacterized protein n=1 Tax=Lottia gigantea TaxID=225164 RepID=V3ZPA0_LOTGI|nr:hypothetical protein LOTGIDRAFT_161780 [Lottia gigantea]ESO93228.1 hypothetical protein LOTGIDRAFT_161780 [Lottia gigantea]
MASNSKYRQQHVYRHDVHRKHVIPVPVVHVSPEIANAIRRRDGIGGVDYWNHDSGGHGYVYRPVRRVTVEEAFPRLSGNGIDKPSKSSKFNNKSIKNSEIKKSKSLDVESKEFHSDPGRNYHVYNAKIRYDLEKDVTTYNNLGSKSSKPDKKVSTKQNGHVIQQHIGNASDAIPNGTMSRLQPNGNVGLPSYRVISSGKDSISNQKQSTWSEMTHLTVNGSLNRFPETAFQKVGMNHTFRIPRPKATISRNNSLIRESINLTASKKRGVTFGQDKVYEYTPQEPLNHYPIHEELI